MPKYIFASLRGPDFEIEGEDPYHAYSNLINREKDNGSLWKLGDEYRNKMAVQKEGFQYLGATNIAYKTL